jgi:hypothetical protein
MPRLTEEAMDARLRALWLGPSAERDWLIREARYCEAAAHSLDWATSRGLQPGGAPIGNCATRAPAKPTTRMVAVTTVTKSIVHG